MMLTVLFASAFSAAAESNPYEVSTDDELSTALQSIANSADTEATIVLKADLNAPTFGGIDGKKVVFTSEAGNCYSIQMANTLTGDITLDAVKFGGSLIYANGHTFETTGNFQGYSGSATLYGGGPEGQDVAGDTNLILRGKASYSWVYGGGCNSNVGGSTYILVDDKNTSTGNLTGGGESTNTNPTAAPVGTVGGDTHVTIQKGYRAIWSAVAATTVIRALRKMPAYMEIPMSPPVRPMRLSCRRGLEPLWQALREVFPPR